MIRPFTNKTVHIGTTHVASGIIFRKEKNQLHKLPQLGQGAGNLVLDRAAADGELFGDLVVRKPLFAAHAEDPAPLFGHFSTTMRISSSRSRLSMALSGSSYSGSRLALRA